MMREATRRLLHWSPRVLGLLFAGFLGVFALDVFGEGADIGETIVAAAIHLIPTFPVLIRLAPAWKWSGLGAIDVGLGSGLYWTAPALNDGPPLLTGLLFALDWRHAIAARPRLRTS